MQRLHLSSIQKFEKLKLFPATLECQRCGMGAPKRLWRNGGFFSTLSSSGRFLRNQGWERMPATVMLLAGLPTKILEMMSTHSRDRCRFWGKLYFMPMILCSHMPGISGPLSSTPFDVYWPILARSCMVLLAQIRAVETSLLQVSCSHCPSFPKSCKP